MRQHKRLMLPSSNMEGMHARPIGACRFTCCCVAEWPALDVQAHNGMAAAAVVVHPRGTCLKTEEQTPSACAQVAVHAHTLPTAHSPYSPRCTMPHAPTASSWNIPTTIQLGTCQHIAGTNTEISAHLPTGCNLVQQLLQLRLRCNACFTQPICHCALGIIHQLHRGALLLQEVPDVLVVDLQR